MAGKDATDTDAIDINATDIDATDIVLQIWMQQTLM